MTPDTNPDRFLLAYFAEQERRSSAPGLSIEPRGDRDPERAQYREAAWTWRCVVMGSLERDGRLRPIHIEVMRAFYLALTVEHVALIRMRSQGQEQAAVIGRRDLVAGQAPPECAEVQSFVSWRALGAALGIEPRRCERLWRQGRSEVALELHARLDCPASPDDGAPLFDGA